MWPDQDGMTAPSPPPPGWKWSSWRIPSDHLALVVGAFFGGALILALLAGVIAWRCCILPRRHKSYCTRIAEEMAIRQQRMGVPVFHSHSAVYADAKKGHWAYNSRLVSASHPPPFALDPAAHWFYNSHVLSPANLDRLDSGPMPRSVSYVHEHRRLSPTDRKRPLSQPIRFGPCDLATNYERRSYFHLPQISEFSPNRPQFASSSISFILTVLDEVAQDGSENIGPGTRIKTRSLPSWVRSRQRPSAAEENLSDLYAKVNFSKKRKNRMRNDEAAIIALSKSRSQFLHKDTDCLVDNEAVIVYNERTAL